MAYQPETPNYDVGVYQLQTADPVQGGAGGVSNSPLLNLANRTAYLKQHIDAIEAGSTIPPTVASLASPAFTGTPTAPTPATGDNSTKIATTAFVQTTVNGMATVALSNANVTLLPAQYGQGIIYLNGTLTANVSVIFPNQSGKWTIYNATSGAFTVTCKTAAGTGVAVAQGLTRNIFGDGTNIYLQTSDFNNAALTGTATAPTAAIGDISTNISTTAFANTLKNGIVTVNVAGNSNVTLTPSQWGNGIINLTGAITGNISVVFPSMSGQWVVANNTTGSFNITAKTAAGVGVILPATLGVVIFCDGTNIYFASSSAQVAFTPVSFAPAAGTTSLTIVGGYTVGNIMVEKNGALIEPADYTATDGVTVQVPATSAGDLFTVYVFASFQVTNAVKKTGDVMSGSLLVPSGTVSAPALAVGAVNSGLYSPGTGVLGLVTGGVLGLRQDASQNISAPGSASFGSTGGKYGVSATSGSGASGGGSYFAANIGGVTNIAIGNKSALLGGAYDGTPLLYGATTIATNVGMAIGGAISVTGNITMNGNTQVLSAGNYNSYAPTLTGGGASGTWGINITGNAASVTNGVYNNGGTYGINISGNSGSTSQTNFSNLTIGGSQVLYAGNYNSYAPTLTGGGASGTWGINITGNAASVTNGVYNNGGTYGINISGNSGSTSQTDFSNLKINGSQVLYSALFPASVNYYGYQKFSTGIIQQWGFLLDVAPGASVTFSFPITFPNGIWVAFANGDGPVGSNNTQAYGLSTTGMTVYNGQSGTGKVYWFAIGF